jgi:two-component system NtrC family response regulator
LSSEDTRIIGESPEIRRAIALARRLAVTDMSILLVGATGTGKELFAEEIHRWSGRRGAFVDVNCGAFPRDMTEALLFGHRRGSFTGAHEHASGLVEEANTGTLFLDELLSMPVEAQPKLLRVLETGEVRRVGETSKRGVRLRTIAAVQENVAQRLAEGNFRLDLLQRLAGTVIELPSLSERGDDVVLLAKRFAERFGYSLASEAEPVLRSHSWPGNLRELHLAIERAALLSDTVVLSAHTIADSIDLGASMVVRSAFGRSLAPSSRPPSSTRERVLSICADNHWHAGRSAQALGLSRTTFFKQLKILGISLRSERASLDFRVRRLSPP